MPDKEAINSKMIKRTFEISKVTFERLKNIKKTRGIPMSWFVERAIENELNDLDRYEKIDKHFEKLIEKVSEAVSKTVKDSSLAEILEAWKNDIQPGIDLARLQSAEFKARQQLLFEKLKLNILYRIAISLPLSEDLVSLRSLESLQVDQYILRLPRGEYQLNNLDIQPIMDSIS